MSELVWSFCYHLGTAIFRDKETERLVKRFNFYEQGPGKGGLELTMTGLLGADTK